MATNTVTFMRQSAVNPDQMHSFVKDKQAWENAIAMYQGPDPLDHWYNYICWYENHGPGDLENKYRETLERCLTIYERSEYYNQDLRMVRLWLKYIDMQPNPLHFYQVLFHRGTGRQVSEFYIHWANCYETMSSFKESESVYAIGFQEKAEPLGELHNAHNKFLYRRTIAIQEQQQEHQELQQQEQQAKSAGVQQEQIQVHYQQQQQAQPQQVQSSSSLSQHNHHAHHNHQQEQQQAHVQSQSQPRIFAQPTHKSEQQSLQQQQLTQQQQQQQIYHRQQHLQLNQQHYQQSQHQHPAYNQQHLQQQQQQHIQQQQQPQQQHHQYQEAIHNNQLNQQQPPQSISQQLERETNRQAAAGQHHAEQQHQHLQQQASLSNGVNQAQMNNHNKVSNVFQNVEGIQLPRNFASYARNCNETWKPALTLEEPNDPYRICHYPKQLVYPTGASIEYSPEELLACKYKKLLEQKRLQRQQQQQEMMGRNISLKEEQRENHLTNSKEKLQAAEGELQRYQHQQQQETLYLTAISDQERNNNDDTNHNSSSYNEGDDETEDNETSNEQENVEDGEEDDEDDDEYDGDDDVEEYQRPLTTTYSDDQIEASTIRFSMQTAEQGIQNKTIKIKFKKEPPSGNKSLNGSSEYSAYTIESIYQQEIQKTSTSQRQYERQRVNGHHSFHPYMLGQTSTPKSHHSQNHHHHQHDQQNVMANGTTNTTFSSSKRSKNKIKCIQQNNKFQNIVVCSNSNSSSADQAAAVALGGERIATTAVANTVSVTGLGSSNNNVLHNVTFNDNANFSFSSAAALDNSNCSITTAVKRLNFRDSTIQAGNTNNNNNNNTNNNNNSTVLADFSTFQENSYFATQHDTEAKERRLAKAIETIERHMAKEAIDPFNSELCRAFLTKLDFPGEDDAHANYKIIQTPLPKIANTRTLNLPDAVQFNIDKEVGRGTYGSVFKATDMRTNNVVALKYQKPPNSWEIYICDQVLKRIEEPSVLPGLMDISTAIIAPNASLIATEFSPFGSLLDINNKIRQATKKVMHESLVMHFSAQICNIIHYLHMNKIIHADIKPDNFLLMRLPSTDLGIPSLRLIDFGCAIDMTLFPDPDDTKFRKVIQTDAFTCIEMQEGRPWSYETDLFCIAGTIHVMLFGEYMQLQNRCGDWDIRQKLPRYLKKIVWTKFFGDVLNIKAGKLPNLFEMRDIFEEEAYRMDSELQKQIRWLSNLLRCR